LYEEKRLGLRGRGRSRRVLGRDFEGVFLGVFGVWLRLFDVERVCKMNEVVKGLDDC